MGENDKVEDKNLDDKGTGNQDDKSKAGGADDKGAAADDKGGEGDDKSKSDAGDGKGEDKSKEPAPKIADDQEPPARKRNIDFIEKRQADKKAKDAAGKGDAGDDKGDDDIDDEDAEIIGKEVKKIMSPFIAKQMQDEDKQEIANYIAANPDFKPYAEKVAKYAQHPSRSHLPIETIFYEVAGKDLLKIGADRLKKANEEAEKTKGGGGDGGAAEVEKPTWNMTPEEFAKKQEEVRRKV